MGAEVNGQGELPSPRQSPPHGAVVAKCADSAEVDDENEGHKCEPQGAEGHVQSPFLQLSLVPKVPMGMLALLARLWCSARGA